MKIIQIMIFFVILNGVFIMLHVANIYPNVEKLNVNQSYGRDDTDFTTTESFMPLLTDLGFTGFIAGSAMLMAIGLAIFAHVNPFTSLAYGLMAGLFVDTIRKIFGIFDNIADAIGPVARPIFFSVIAIFAVVVLFLFLNSLRQMGTQGDRGLD